MIDAPNNTSRVAMTMASEGLEVTISVGLLQPEPRFVEQFADLTGHHTDSADEAMDALKEIVRQSLPQMIYHADEKLRLALFDHLVAMAGKDVNKARTQLQSAEGEA